MITLHTLGETHLSDDSGRPLGGAATQRRTLALLSVLAIAGDAGLSRDKLVGLLWPRAEEERARHSLTQGLYAARRALQCDDLFVTSTSAIRLDFDRIACDARTFESLLAQGELEAAAGVYGGPFLDGFFLSGSPEFDQWSAAQRDRLQGLLVQALEQLATRAEEAEDFARAADWRRRLVACAPLDSSNVVRLMRAMARAGDRAGAIQQARVHAALLEQELELEPDPVVESLAEELRTGTSWLGESDAREAAPREAAPREAAPRADQSADASPEAAQRDDAAHVDDEEVVGPSLPIEGEPIAELSRAVPAVPVARADRSATPWRGSTLARPMAEIAVPIWLRWTILSVVVLTLISAGVLIGRSRRGGAPAVEQLAVKQRVVVAPFRVSGAAPSLAYLRDGMVELLSTRLADDSAARSVDAGAVLGAWRAAGLAPAMDVSRDTVVKLAAQLGAERVVVGSVVGTPARVIFRASVLLVPSGKVSADASIAGPVENLTSLIDRLAGQLLASEAGEDQQLALQTTRSLPALRAYLAGQAALRALDYTAAQRYYDSALRRDSSFALAALRAAIVADRLFDAPQLQRALAIAWAHRDALSDRDEMLLSAYVGPRYPAPPTRAELLAAWQRIVDASTTDADLWYALGTRIVHDGTAAGLSDAAARAREALEHAAAAAPHPAARGLLATLGAVPVEPAAGPATLGPFAPFVRWRAAVARGDSALVAHLRDTMFRLGPANLRAIAMSSQYEGVGLGDGARALEFLEARATRPADHADALLGEHAHALVRGHVREAAGVVARLARLQPESPAPLRLRVLDALYASGDSAAAADAADELSSRTGLDPSAGLTSSETWSANLCVLGQWQLARGDTAAVRRSAGALRTHAARDSATSSEVASAAPGACAELLSAAHAVLTRARDARSRLQHVDSLVLVPQIVGDLATYAPLLIARLHERLGNPTAALAALRRRPYMSEWPRYLGTIRGEVERLER
ncbi:MAG TPA: BTAD domain-containing putative transcriptional regulator [Gemmatimonadaceae bacterium]|nr:BTAD domain-containing putative transcriptional regulator [Gemmatimonadaceae bacterium]